MTTHPDLQALRDQAVALSTELPGPLTRLRVRLGDAAVDVEWSPLGSASTSAATEHSQTTEHAKTTERRGPGASHVPSGDGDVGQAAPGPHTGSSTAVAQPDSPARDDAEPAGEGGGAAYAGVVGSVDAEPGTVVTAALVGAFYRAPAPGAAPYAEVGAAVTAGQQVACLEAMKLLTPVQAPCDGVLAEVLAQDGDLVAFGQPLVRIEPSR